MRGLAVAHAPARGLIASLVCLAAMLAAWLGPVAVARAEFRVPALTGPVVDDAAILKPETKRVLENAIRALHEQGGAQLNVLTVRSLEGLSIEQASIQVVDAWKLGGSKADNGALLLIAPKERRMRIEVGQGLEGVLTDADSKRIIAEGITPLFKAGDFDSGIVVGVYQIARKTNPEINLEPYLEGQIDRAPRGSGGHSSLRFWFILLMIIFFLIFNGLGGGRGGRRLRRAGYAGGWGGGGWGGGGGGFGGGGGWSGGGGGFSGGGASGGW